MSTLHLNIGFDDIDRAYDTVLLYYNGWLSSFSNSQDGRYDYHAFYSWFILAHDDSFSIFVKMWYIDIEKDSACLADGLMVRQYLELNHHMELQTALTSIPKGNNRSTEKYYKSIETFQMLKGSLLHSQSG